MRALQLIGGKFQVGQDVGRTAGCRVIKIRAAYRHISFSKESGCGKNGFVKRRNHLGMICSFLLDLKL